MELTINLCFIKSDLYLTKLIREKKRKLFKKREMENSDNFFSSFKHTQIESFM